MIKVPPGYNITPRTYNKLYRMFYYVANKRSKVCDEWRFDKMAFIDWCILKCGYRKGWRLKLINPKGKYEPSNCRFVKSKVKGVYSNTNYQL